MVSLEGPTISRYELGNTQINADDLPRFAEALGCSPCDFFEPRPTPEEPPLTFPEYGPKTVVVDQFSPTAADNPGRAHPPALNRAFGRTATRDAIPREGEGSAAEPSAYGQELGQQLGADLIDTLRHMSPERGALLMDFIQWLEEREKAGER